ncbi:FMN-binding negative transcriptional regulator [Saccharopolyspora sp. 5N102]|uniref:FMN-binding negative transcriptional regulator n=1 Tax=Saccharopolyspora sp. 5N102 TaxID=3375155 RepID=UPI00378C9400
MEGRSSLYVPPHFRETRAQMIVDVVTRNPFGILVTCSSAGEPEASHLAFTYHPNTENDGHGVVLGHLAIANPQCESIRQGKRATIIFSGPHHYISPRFYRTSPSTPTWNYCAVHMTGHLDPTPESGLDETLSKLTDSLEKGYQAPFRYESLSPSYTATRKPGILAFRMTVESIDAQFKMSQNRTAEDRRGVIKGLRGLHDQGADAVASIMDRLLREAEPEN